MRSCRRHLDRRRPRPISITAALTALNFGQLPASFLLLAFASQIERRTWPFVATGILSLGCIAGIVLTANVWTVVFAGGLGFAAGFGFTLALTLPPLLTAPDDVARIVGGDVHHQLFARRC